MKKIIQISLENYKGYIQKETIMLPKGENLLIYGENGSGKSSLFNALKHFLQSSIDNTKSFDSNIFSTQPDGKIELTFSDYDTTTGQLVPDTEQCFAACKNATSSTNGEPFIRLGNRLSGFLDYSQLLKVYMNKGPRPNLFDLVNDLIGDFIPTGHGIAVSLRELMDNIHQSLHKSYQRKNRTYQEGKQKFNQLQAAYLNIIGDLDTQLNNLISTYFPDFNLGLHLAGTNITLDESGRILDSKIKGSVFIDVTHHGVALTNYNSRLNEARLSAIAICLYLASLKLRNRHTDMKLLYLDDVFIGLDSANRRPILNILNNEFTDYQIIISTYDKSWYSLATEILNDTDKWKYIELYEGETTIGGHNVVKPIIIEGSSDIDKAKAYLCAQDKPDYPAAANYMRKAFEELLQTKIYPSAIKDDNLENIPGYKIPNLISKSKIFLGNLQHEPNASKVIGLLEQLTTYLRPMLHPLSHYAPTQPVYKKELAKALDIYENISQYLKDADYISNLNPILTRGSKFVFKIEGTDWKLEYALQAEYDMFSYTDTVGNRQVSLCDLRLKAVTETDKKTGKSSTRTISKGTKNPPKHEYTSIDELVATISTFLRIPAIGKSDCIVLNPITDMFFLPVIDTTSTPEVKYSCVLTSVL